jgi:hypothetical protein
LFVCCWCCCLFDKSAFADEREKFSSCFGVISERTLHCTGHCVWTHFLNSAHHHTQMTSLFVNRKCRETININNNNNKRQTHSLKNKSTNAN